MTVVMAVRCADGLVIAADSQITENDRGMSFPAQKLHQLGTHAAWGGSGARGVQVDLHRVFDEEADAILAADDVGDAIQERTLPVLRHHYERFIPDVPGEDLDGTPSAYVLAAGYQGDDPWIVEVTPNGLLGRYEDIGFHAIGSGAAMAQQASTLLAHFRMIRRPLPYGLVATVRVLDALTRTAPNVGGPLTVCRLTPDGVETLDDDEVAEIREHVARWEDQEQRVLDELF
jgi:proteasome beta subunit